MSDIRQLNSLDTLLPEKNLQSIVMWLARNKKQAYIFNITYRGIARSIYSTTISVHTRM